MNGSEGLKKPKREIESMEEDQEQQNPEKSCRTDDNDSEGISGRDEEEALVALIEHRTKEVEHLRNRISYYQSQLGEAERRLEHSQNKLVHVRRKISDKLWNHSVPVARKEVKLKNASSSPIQNSEGSTQRQPQSKPPLVISNPNPKSSRASSVTETGSRAPPSSSDSLMKARADQNQKTPSEPKDTKSQIVGAKRKPERREHKELVSMVRSRPSPSLIHCNASTHISSQHKRKLRSLSICPVNEQLFITSALDGRVNLWQIQAKGSGASLLSSTDCLSPKQGRWPEDIAWHPEGSRLLAVYSADGGDNQISVLNLNKSQSARVTFLEQKPHVKGIINSISFMPWDEVCFVTGGSDHAVMIWDEKDGENMWKQKALHRNLHSSAVMGVAGIRHKNMVVSAGADRRIFGYDVRAGRADYKHQIDSKCMSVLPNPCDFNLFMVQTGTPERQLRLFDIRLRKSELHAFGWKQESSESQSALINQAWSPDGLYLTSGSADPMIHIFDIRYNSHKPSQSVQAHQKRVFKAEWHYSLPLLISISSDLNIGLHKI